MVEQTGYTSHSNTSNHSKHQMSSEDAHFLGHIHNILFPSHQSDPSIIRDASKEVRNQFRYVIEELLFEAAEQNPLTKETIRDVIKEAEATQKVNGAAKDIEDFLLKEFDDLRNPLTLKDEKKLAFFIKARQAVEAEKDNGTVSHIREAINLIETNSKNGITAESIRDAISFVQTPNGGYTKLGEQQKQRMEQLLMNVFTEVAKSPDAKVNSVYNGYNGSITKSDNTPHTIH